MVTVSGNSNPSNPTNPTTINSGELTDKNPALMDEMDERRSSSHKSWCEASACSELCAVRCLRVAYIACMYDVFACETRPVQPYACSALSLVTRCETGLHPRLPQLLQRKKLADDVKLGLGILGLRLGVGLMSCLTFR